MYAFLFIIPNCVMEFNVMQREKKTEEKKNTNSGVRQHSTYFISRQNKENEHLFFPPAFLDP